jgi:hypothetical protein
MRIGVKVTHFCSVTIRCRHKFQAYDTYFSVLSLRNFLVWLKKNGRNCVGFNMLGVVLWSDAADGKAVIWCEDQGDLAYVRAQDSVLQAGDFFDAGDLIQFDMEMSQSVRVANNPRLVFEKAGPNLPQVLLNKTEDGATRQASAEVIRFSRDTRFTRKAG